MKIEIAQIPIGKLKPARYNPRTIEDGALEALSASIEHFGLVVPIVWNKKTGHVVGGNQRLEILKRTKQKSITCSVVSLSLKQEKILNLRLNNLSGTWDSDRLSGILKAIDRDDWGLTGFDEDVIKPLVLEGDVEPEEPIPDLPKKAITKPGDLWTLGDHRVLCGDATKAEDVVQVLNASPARILWTDPPYGVDYVGSFSHKMSPAKRRAMGGLTIKGDDSDEEALEELLRSSLTIAMQHCKKGSAWYLCSPPGPLHFCFLKVLRELGVWRSTLVWVKHSLVMGRGDYHYRHESILYGWVPGAKHYFTKDRTQDSVMEFPRPTVSKEHPTMKPVALVEQCLANSSRRGWLCFDPFLGSGTTLIAAEQLGRRCYGLEIEPKYVDVSIERWMNLTGNEVTLERDGHEETWTKDDLAARAGRRK